jgi:hypothetical protein
VDVFGQGEAADLAAAVLGAGAVLVDLAEEAAAAAEQAVDGKSRKHPSCTI